MSAGGRLLRGFAQLSLVELVVRLLTLIGLVAIARYLGPTALGQFAVAQAVLMYAGAVTDAGLKTLAQREMVANRAQASAWASSTVAVQFAAAAVLGGMVAVASPLLPFDQGTERVLVALTPLLLAQALNVQFVLQTYERFGALAVSRLVTQAAVTGGTLAVLATGQSIVWVAFAAWAGTLLGDGLSLLLARRGLEAAFGRVSRGGVRTLLSHAAPFLGLTVLSLIAQNADVLVIGATLSSAEAGQYSAALRVVVILIGFAALVVSVSLTEMVRVSAQEGGQLGHFLQDILRPMCQAAYAAAALLIVAADQLLTAALGNEFDAAGPVLRVLALAVPLGFCNSVLAQGLVASGAQRSYVVVAAVTASFCVVSLMLIVPREGIVSAAIIMIVGEVISLVGLTVAFRRRWHATPAVELIRQLGWLAVPLGVLTLVRQTTHQSGVTLALWGLVLIGMDALSGFVLSRRTLSLMRREPRISPEGE